MDIGNISGFRTGRSLHPYGRERKKSVSGITRQEAVHLRPSQSRSASLWRSASRSASCQPARPKKAQQNEMSNGLIKLIGACLSAALLAACSTQVAPMTPQPAPARTRFEVRAQGGTVLADFDAGQMANWNVVTSHGPNGPL